MTAPRMFAGCHVLDPEGKILLAGGIGTGFTKLNSVELYDIAAGSWTQVGGMPMALPFFFTVGLDFVSMDLQGTNLYIYNKATDAWDVDPTASLPSTFLNGVKPHMKILAFPCSTLSGNCS